MDALGQLQHFSQFLTFCQPLLLRSRQPFKRMGNAVCYDGSVYPTNKLYTFDDTPEPYKIEEIWPRWCIRNPLITPKIGEYVYL